MGQANCNYSNPFFTISGELILPEGPVAVSGSAWLDRKWSSQPLADNQTCWDWFSLSFDTGDKLMAFQLRQTDDSTFSSGMWINRNGSTTMLADGDVRTTPQDTGPK